VNDARAAVTGFQGEPGAFSDEAAHALLGESIETRGYGTFEDLLEALARGEVEHALLPCENTIAGSIARAYDLLLQYEDVAIVDETTHAIEQCLIAPKGATIDRLESVASHPVALEQCRLFLSAHPRLRVDVAQDTAGAVRQCIEHGDARAGAIGPALAARRYGGVILQRGVQDDAGNQTRFFLLSRARHARRNLGRVCFAISLPHKTGSLSRALAALAAHGLNLRSLLARPNRKRPFEYVFYLEIDTPKDGAPAEILAGLGGETRILGVY
jgi:prephenate dehydratase